MIHKRLFLWLLPLLLLVGCEDWGTTNNPDTTGTDTNTGIFQTDESSDRQQEENDLRQRFTELQGELAGVEAQSNSAGFTSVQQELEQLEARIQIGIENLSASTGTLWENNRDRVENMLDEFEQGIDDYRNLIEEAQDTTVGTP